MDIDTGSKTISKSQVPLEVRYYLITGKKNNIPKCHHRRTTAFCECVVFFFLKKKKIITLNIKGSLNMKNK